MARSGVRWIPSALGAGLRFLLRIRRTAASDLVLVSDSAMSAGWQSGRAITYHPWWGGYRGGFGVVDIHNYYNVRGGFAPLHNGGFSNFRDIDQQRPAARRNVQHVVSRFWHRRRARARCERGRTSAALAESPERHADIADAGKHARLRPARKLSGHSRRTPTSTFSRSRRRQRREGSRDKPAADSIAAPPVGPLGGFNRGPASTPQQSSPADGSDSRASLVVRAGNPAAAGNVRGSQPSYRPPLSMNRPIVNENQRANGGNGGRTAIQHAGYRSGLAAIR